MSPHCTVPTVAIQRNAPTYWNIWSRVVPVLPKQYVTLQRKRTKITTNSSSSSSSSSSRKNSKRTKEEQQQRPHRDQRSDEDNAQRRPWVTVLPKSHILSPIMVMSIMLRMSGPTTGLEEVSVYQQIIVTRLHRCRSNNRYSSK